MNNTNGHTEDGSIPEPNEGTNAIDPCIEKARKQAEYNRGVRCKNCKLIFCILASIAVAAGVVLLISGAVALWPKDIDVDDNTPLIFTVPQICCQDNDDHDNDDDDNDNNNRHDKHKDRHHNNDDD